MSAGVSSTQPPDRRGAHTRAVHPPAAPVPAEQPLGLAVHRSSTFAFDTAQDYADVLAGRAQGYTYSRIDNPTVDAFARAVAALEGYGAAYDVTGQAFASGMAAISTVLMANLTAGDHVVAPAAVYGGTYGLVRNVLSRFGVESTFVDVSDLAAVAAAMRPTTTVLWAETLSNPTMAVADLPGLARIAHEAEALLIVDSTFASPVVCRPLEHGADLVVHSATKYLGGHSDVTGGVVVGRPELVTPVRALRCELGGSLSPDDAFLLHRGLTTLPLRMERHCSTALAVARVLEHHPQLVRVDYPGLVAHPSHLLADQLFSPGVYGAVVTITPRGGWDAGMALCDRLQLVAVATSLGGAHSLVSHVASTTHRQFDEAALAAAGIDPGAVRVSIGLEDADDLLSDLTAAIG